MGKPAGRNKRSAKKLFIAPSRQLKLTFAMLSIGILVTALLLAYLVTKVSQTVDLLEPSHPSAALIVTDSLSPVLNLLIAGQALLWIFCLLVGVLVSHKIYGPLVPMLRHVRNLQEGSYSSRVKLREGDELEDLAGALNELAEKLEGREKKAGQ
jgi:HAMP domain-containing protein